jgi:DNA-binding NarL/FixJ family response regulator
VRCLIVDDSAVFVQAACRLLEHDGITIGGVASTTEEAMRRFQELAPDLTLVHVELGDESGFDLAEQLIATGSQTPVILVSTHTAEQFEDMIAASPATGFICKADLTVDAITALVDGSAQRPEGDQR